MIDSIYANGILSIKLGIDDIRSSNPDRILSATRNITAGILLLLKQVIIERTPGGTDILLAEHVQLRIRDGALVPVPLRRDRTIKAHQIFDVLRNTLHIEERFPQIDRLIEYRNAIEHSQHPARLSSQKGLLMATYEVVDLILTRYLGRDTQTELGTVLYREMLTERVFHARQWEKCQATWAAAGLRDELLPLIARHGCLACPAKLMRYDHVADDAAATGARCTLCERLFPLRHYVEITVAREYEDPWKPYNMHTCMECGYDAFVLSLGHCLHCGGTTRHVAPPLSEASWSVDD